ncbi:MAG: hypothetical protein ACLU5I_05620 [Alistipes finegoldii]
MKRIIFLPAIAALLCGACSSAVPEDYTQYVDPYIGTGDHGHVFMGANVPFEIRTARSDEHPADMGLVLRLQLRRHDRHPGSVTRT